YYYQIDLPVGETLIYQRHDYNFTTQMWNSWSYFMYEITSIENTIVELEHVMVIKAAQWVSDDSIHWKQVLFITNAYGPIQTIQTSETGIISRLQEVPIHRFSGLQDENFIIQPEIKIGDISSSIETKINSSLDEEDWVILEPINDGFGLKITVSECGCSVEGGTNRRIRNITYSTRGILSNYYYSERVDYGPDAQTIQQETEFFLLNEFEFDGLVLENLSTNWQESFSSSYLNSEITYFDQISLVFGLIILLFWTRKKR
ncbi:MAG: hypothetical protein ACTSQH_06900, partial [Candidatus Hodarchaeales archaeon]